MRSIGLDPADLAQREQAFVSMYAAHANRINTHSSPMADDTLRSRSGKADILNEARPQGMGQSIKQALSDNIVKDLATGKVSLLHSAWNMVNPLRTRGSLRKESGKWVQSGKNNMIAATAGAVREHMDNTVRMGSILNLMDDGMDFTQAFDRVAWHQVNYDRRFFTKFEQRWAKTIFPFYSFVSRSIPMVAMELATNPGGPLGRVIRAQRIAQSGDDYVPYDLQDSAAIPLGKNEEGDLRYITNLGLMHEEAVRYLGAPVTGVRPLLQKIIGSSSPFVKGIVEYGMNTSTFFDGPMGGRRLDDLDPSIGRILANIGLREIPPSGRPEPFGGPMVEAMAANSPLAAALSYLKVMTESRDRRGLREKAVNLLTGLRTRQITPEMLSRELRDRLNAEQVKLGARPVTIVSGTKGLSQRYSETGSDEEVAKLAMLERALAIVRKQAEERSERRAGGGK